MEERVEHLINSAQTAGVYASKIAAFFGVSVEHDGKGYVIEGDTKDVLTACFDNGDKTMVVIFKDVYVVPLQHYQLATDGSASVGESHNEFKLIGGVKEW